MGLGWVMEIVTQDVLCHLLAVQNVDSIHAQKKALTQENIIENTKAGHYMQQVSRDAQDAIVSSTYLKRKGAVHVVVGSSE